MLIEIGLAVIAAAAVLGLAGRLVNPQPVIRGYSKFDYDAPRASQTNSWKARASYGSEPGALVFGWPAKGGVYVHRASAVEIEFLGLRQLCPEWWESEEAWFLDQISVRLGMPGLRESYPRTGWPAEDGVRVLKADEGIAAGKGAGMLFNADSMEKRCKVIEQLGGIFYANPKDCPDLDLA